ncbi:hypothetical protein BGW80DRAFT_1254532 [Lactifluus volemus]|nr:hypothetical protein BGW80DRAFT_1254532 [Lactifluus volemus]
MPVAAATLRLIPSIHTSVVLHFSHQVPPTNPNDLLSQFSNFMGQHAMASKMVFNRPVSVNRLVSVIAEAQVNTQEYGDVHTVSASSSSGWTTSDHTLTSSRQATPPLSNIPCCLNRRPLEDLIRHWLHALREILQQDKELATINTSISILGPCGIHEAEGTPVNFRILEGTPVEVYRGSVHGMPLKSSIISLEDGCDSHKYLNGYVVFAHVQYESLIVNTGGHCASSMLRFSGYAALENNMLAISDESLTNISRGRTEEDTKKGTSPERTINKAIAMWNRAPSKVSRRLYRRWPLVFSLLCANVPSIQLLAHQNATHIQATAYTDTVT